MSRRRRPDARDVDGILLLDKPEGLSSNAALQRVKRHFRAAKAGHTGSLDPLATGLLPICLGRATRVSAFLLDSDKRYRATARLGVRSSTGDAEGVATAHSDPSSMKPDALAQALAGFLGEQKQVPPMYSALKRDGQPLYALARKGISVDRPPRSIIVHELRLLEEQSDAFMFEVCCSKGTYVRTLAEDWAAAAGQCAHLIALRRIGVGRYGEADMHPLAQIEATPASQVDTCLRPLAEAFADWPSLRVDAAAAQRLAQGQVVHVAAASPAGDVAVFDADGSILCIARVDAAGRVAPRRWLGPSARE